MARLPRLAGKSILLLMSAAFLARLGAVIALRDMSRGPGEEMGADGIEFNLLALRVAEGQGYTWPSGETTSFRAPGFPLFLSGIYAVAGESYLLVYLAFCLLGALSCLLTYLLARELVDEGIARIAAALSVIYPPGIYMATVFASENLFVPCLALALWLFIRHLKTGALPLLAIAGLVLGWGTLTRPFTVLLLPVLLGLLVWHQRSQKGEGRQRSVSLVPLVTLAATFLMVLLPWTIRNYHVHGRMVLVATNGGSTFYGANNDRVARELRYLGGWIATTELPGRDVVEATPDEVNHDQMEWRLGLQWVRENLTRMPLLSLFKFLRLWLPEMDSGNKAYVLLQLIGYTPFLALFICGAMWCARQRQYRTIPWWAIHATILATVVMALVFYGTPRFRDANMPCLMLYASLGVHALLRSRHTKHWALGQSGP
ncbi:MAG: glycosyltransferase family 39 protein, partial [Armatimonadota bacterium]|nr:glycosyltransferase family 39 protein [Armatimonadota bacterium]